MPLTANMNHKFCLFLTEKVNIKAAGNKKTPHKSKTDICPVIFTEKHLFNQQYEILLNHNVY